MKKIVALLFIAAHKMALAQNAGIGVINPLYKLNISGRMKIRTDTIGNF